MFVPKCVTFESAAAGKLNKNSERKQNNGNALQSSNAVILLADGPPPQFLSREIKTYETLSTF